MLFFLDPWYMFLIHGHNMRNISVFIHITELITYLNIIPLDLILKSWRGNSFYNCFLGFFFLGG